MERRHKVVVFCVTAALMGFSLAAHAKKVSKSIRPPPEFDHPYEGRIKVKRDSSGSLPCRPISLSTRLGCAYPPDEPGGECPIYLAFPRDIKDAGYTENAVLRHEIAHCNGWKEYRPLPGKD